MNGGIELELRKELAGDKSSISLACVMRISALA